MWDLDLKQKIATYTFLLEIVCHSNRITWFTLCLRIGGNCHAKLMCMDIYLLRF